MRIRVYALTESRRQGVQPNHRFILSRWTPFQCHMCALVEWTNGTGIACVHVCVCVCVCEFLFWCECRCWRFLVCVFLFVGIILCTCELVLIYVCVFVCVCVCVCVQHVDPVCTFLYELYLRKQEDLQVFVLQFIPALVWSELSLRAQFNTSQGMYVYAYVYV